MLGESIVNGTMSAVMKAHYRNSPHLPLVLKIAPPQVDVCQQAHIYQAWEATANKMGLESPRPQVQSIDTEHNAILLAYIDNKGPVKCAEDTIDEELRQLVPIFRIFEATKAPDLVYEDKLAGLDLKILGNLETWGESIPDQRKDLWISAIKESWRIVSEIQGTSLLHNDLWVGNVLDGPVWKVIDPYARPGNIMSDTGYWASGSADGQNLQERCRKFSERLEVDYETVTAYAILWSLDRTVGTCKEDLNPIRKPSLATAIENWITQ